MIEAHSFYRIDGICGSHMLDQRAQVKAWACEGVIELKHWV